MAVAGFRRRISAMPVALRAAEHLCLTGAGISSLARITHLMVQAGSMH